MLTQDTRYSHKSTQEASKPSCLVQANHSYLETHRSDTHTDTHTKFCNHDHTINSSTDAQATLIHKPPQSHESNKNYANLIAEIGCK